MRIRIDTMPSNLDGAVEALYPGASPFWLTPEEGPLTSVAVFAHESGHFHYVTLGLREWGAPFDLTFRLASDRVPDCARAPRWPRLLLEAFARHVQRATRVRAGHYLCLPEPIDPSRKVRCGALLPDPELSPAGERDGFLQIVGLAGPEVGWVSEDEGYLERLAARLPLLVTAPDRAPIAP
ncbi:MAG: suppressor of fused domain protein [Sandaracinaceae bacterium]